MIVCIINVNNLYKVICLLFNSILSLYLVVSFFEYGKRLIFIYK